MFGTTAPPTSADSTRYGNDLIFGGKGEYQIWSNGGDDIIFGERIRITLTVVRVMITYMGIMKTS
ncbi:hypothetical protein IEE82_13745 [Acinetobacter baumannii]|nr:hypothetical protein IEE82_13745 [Acinetobacter baumannii]